MKSEQKAALRTILMHRLQDAERQRALAESREYNKQRDAMTEARKGIFHPALGRSKFLQAAIAAYPKAKLDEGECYYNRNSASLVVGFQEGHTSVKFRDTVPLIKSEAELFDEPQCTRKKSPKSLKDAIDLTLAEIELKGDEKLWTNIDKIAKLVMEKLTLWLFDGRVWEKLHECAADVAETMARTYRRRTGSEVEAFAPEDDPNELSWLHS